jgi:hypothetical protein
MDAEGNGLTLEGLAQKLATQTQRLETLERDNEKMRSENDALQSKLATLEGSQMPRTEDRELPAASELSGFEGKVSRRGLLSKASKAGVAVAGLAVAGALTQRDIREARADPTVFTTNTNSRGAVEGYNDNASGKGVFAQGNIGVHGYTAQSSGQGVLGQGPLYGVHGDSGTGHGVFGETSNAAERAGVRGTGKTGVWGSTSVSGYSGVYGQNTGSGFGVVGDGNGPTRAGVLGRNSSGYGGWFEGGLAQLKLTPEGTAGKPTTGAHTKGEVYLDSAAALFVCVGSGTPGKWRKVTTTAA